MTTSPQAERLVGSVLSGRYRVEAVVAETDHGALYRGEHAHMRKRLAIKVLFPAGVARPDVLARFEREAVAGAHVDHPNVAAAKDFGLLEDGSAFFVMEYLDGPPLRAALAGGPLPLDRALRVGAQIARGLDAAHAIGIVHRALSPDTIYLVERQGERDVVKLVDFGSALLPAGLVEAGPGPIEGRAERIATPIGAMPATIAYAAPEFLAGAPLDGRSDLYALGVVLHEMIAGAPPSRATPRTPLTALGAPAAVEAVVARLLAEVPAGRFANAAEAADAIEAVRGASVANLALPPAERAALATNPTILPAREALELRGTSASVAAAEARGDRARLPLPIQLAASGAVAIVLVVLGALALRAPIPDDAWGAGAEAASAATATPRKAHDGVAPASTATPVAAASSDTPEGTPRELRARFVKDVQTGRMVDAVATLDALLDADGDAAQDRELRSYVVELTQRVTLLEDGTPDRLFDIIAKKMGTTGGDILYEIVSTKGGSRAAKRANELLRDPDVVKRGSPAMQIAWAMRNAKRCEDKIALLDRAKDDGDARTFGQLQLLNRSCRRSEECCLRDEPAFRAALDAIKDRMR